MKVLLLCLPVSLPRQVVSTYIKAVGADFPAQLPIPRVPGKMYQWTLFVFIGLVSAFGTVRDRCTTDFTIGLLYKELGCTPVHEEASKCPSQFDCSHYNKRDSNGCMYKGKIYEIGSELPKFKENPCIAQCRCVGDPSTGRGVFDCIDSECFEEYNPNCTALYNEDSCCSVKSHCEGDPPVPTCLVDGKVYVEGQKFYPKDEPCKQCLCKGGFEGKFEEPFCHDVSCNVELHYAKKMQDQCVPVYFETQGCCPIDWICPKSDEIIKFNGKLPRTTQAVCQFGRLEFQQYDELKTGDSTINCKCLTPPYLTCIKRY